MQAQGIEYKEYSLPKYSRNARNEKRDSGTNIRQQEVSPSQRTKTKTGESMERIRTSALTFMIFCLLCPALAGGTDRSIIGAWSYSIGTFFKADLTIVAEDSKLYLDQLFYDGSSLRVELAEVPARSGEKRRFKARENDFGEVYAINSDGNLDIYDEDGFVREAKKK